jgi:ABC-type Co2+ transport system permease subunit
MKNLLNNLKKNSELTALAAVLFFFAICFAIPSIVHFNNTVLHIELMVISIAPFFIGAVAFFIKATKK